MDVGTHNAGIAEGSPLCVLTIVGFDNRCHLYILSFVRWRPGIKVELAKGSVETKLTGMSASKMGVGGDTEVLFGCCRSVHSLYAPQAMQKHKSLDSTGQCKSAMPKSRYAVTEIWKAKMEGKAVVTFSFFAKILCRHVH